MADEISDQIETDAAKPASAEVDGQKVQLRPLTELIEADKYLAGKRANAGTSSGWSRVRTTRAVPPGAH